MNQNDPAEKPKRAAGNFIGSGCLRYISGEILRFAVILAIIGAAIFFFTSAVQNLYNQVAGVIQFPTISFGPPGLPAIPANIYVPPVERVQALAQLTTTRFNYAQIISSTQDMPAPLALLYGDGLVMVAVGHIDAGIDVSQISAEDIVYSADSQTLTIMLPAPTLQTCFLDEQQSYVASRSTGIFAQPMPNLESSTRRFALREYRETAIEDGILTEAQLKAEEIMSQFLGIVAGENVTVQILFKDADPDTPLPASCG